MDTGSAGTNPLCPTVIHGAVMFTATQDTYAAEPLLLPVVMTCALSIVGAVV